ncbi:hypothetical protein TURU_108517 [Turdus rufiventris]|nr:hypothetical protein TURU_108517 [Turdus rufiventris]
MDASMRSVSDRQTKKDKTCEYEDVPRVHFFKRKKNFSLIHLCLLLDHTWDILSPGKAELVGSKECHFLMPGHEFYDVECDKNLPE